MTQLSDSKKSSWQKIKAKLKLCSENDLISIVSGLYVLSEKNKNFLNARFLMENDSIDYYKKIITKSLTPNFNNPNYPQETVRLKEAKTALSDFKKATGDNDKLIELMFHYLDSGLHFSHQFGGLYAAYYQSLSSVFKSIILLVKPMEIKNAEPHIEHLKQIIEKSKHSGYGFEEYIEWHFSEAFSSIETQDET